MSCIETTLAAAHSVLLRPMPPPPGLCLRPPPGLPPPRANFAHPSALELKHDKVYGRSRLDSTISTACTVSDADEESAGGEEQRRSVIVRNVPNKYTRALFLELLDKKGFRGTYRMVYLPVDYATRLSVGYVFVHFAASCDAARCKAELDGFKDWHFAGSPKVCAVDWSSDDDSLEAHIARLRNCPVMHSSVLEEFKPVLFDAFGARLPFPEPTKTVKKPRSMAGAGHRARRTKGHNAAC